jgi:hypothetical protein
MPILRNFLILSDAYNEWTLFSLNFPSRNWLLYEQSVAKGPFRRNYLTHIYMLQRAIASFSISCLFLIYFYKILWNIFELFCAKELEHIWIFVVLFRWRLFPTLSRTERSVTCTSETEYGCQQCRWLVRKPLHWAAKVSVVFCMGITRFKCEIYPNSWEANLGLCTA